MTVKSLGKTIKSPLLKTIGNTVKYLEKKGIRNLKHIAPYTAKESNI